MTTEVKEKFSAKDSLAHVFFSNPVLVGGLVIGQLSAGDTSLQTGVALTVTFLFVTVPVLVFAAAAGKLLPHWLRIVTYMLISGGMLFPAYLVCRGISPMVFDSVGIYLPLLAVSTIPTAYSVKYSEKHDVPKAFMDGIALSLGFGAVALILGAGREFFGYGTLWGMKITENSFPAISLPFWGFILLGFMAAGVAGVRILFKKPEYAHFGNVKEDEA